MRETTHDRPRPGSELSGARWVYDTEALQEIRRDVMTILTHHGASRQAAMVPYGRMLLGRDGE